MSKAKVKYCNKCRKETIHSFLSKDTIADGMGLIRAVIAIGSLGVSESLEAKKYYRCTRCAKIIEL